MDTPKEIIEKLRKLLRLGESSNIHEAELAMQRAQELATKWKICLSELSEADQAAEDFVREGYEWKKRTFHQRFIDRIINTHFNVKVILRPAGRGVWYIGKPSDITFAKFVNDYLAGEFPRQWQLFRKATPEAHMHTFFYGMYTGLSEKLHEARKATERREFVGRPEAESKYQLAVVNERRALNQAVKSFFPHLGRASGGQAHHRNAASFNGGHAAGRSVNISRPIGGGNGAALQLGR